MNGGNSEHELVKRVLDLIEYLALIIEILAVSVIAIGVVYALIRFLVARYGNETLHTYDRQFRANLGNSLLVGLEILVAADIIRTVALEPSLTNVAILGILVLVRTFLSWSLVVEIEGRWPWKAAEAESRAAAEGEHVE
ncbi:MAG: DUF1622 domain-containing protein [Thermomicrobiales bacterium]|nr:DUF1622 domain-containing protein [Thermomicrobiales bacterium]MCO5223146.1 DUF1622 domain-containing protein [Thermomicrobiales bacterium]